MTSRVGADSEQLELRLGVLGPFLARVEGVWLPAPSRQCARLATVLAGWAGEVVARDRIVEAIWGDDPPATATNTVQVHVSQLRRFLGPRLVQASVGGYRLDISPLQTDVRQFEDGLIRATVLRRHSRYARAAELLGEALPMWRGMPYTDVQDPDLIARRARLRELHEQAREDYLECRLELAGDKYSLASVIADLKELVQLQGTRERSHALVIRALAAAGRISEADTAYSDGMEALTRNGRALTHPLLDAVHDRALSGDPALYPRTSQAISNMAMDAPEGAGAAALAEHVRRLVVDQDAEVVTVVSSEGGIPRSRIVSTIRQHLAGDFAAGVLYFHEEQADLPSMDAEIFSASNGALSTLASMPDLQSLAIILDAPTRYAELKPLLAQLSGLPGRPRVISIAPAPIGTAGEITIDRRTGDNSLMHWSVP